LPYIAQEKRKQFEGIVELAKKLDSVGELNYLITRICDHYSASNGYKKVNDIVGALECVKAEFYRRIAAPYEDYKKNENGEVYQFRL